MTIPEPTDYDRLVILKSMYEKISDAKSTAYVPVSRETALAVISRAYHAERERDQLRARVAELEAAKGVAGE